jgi:septum site-determining protein MinC
MKTKQKHLKVLDIVIDDKSEFFSYADKNYLLLKNFLFELSGNVDGEVREFLDSRNISYVTSDVFKSKEMFRKKSSNSLNELLKGKKKEEKPQKMTIYEPLRSGQEIEEDIDIVIFGRINSGSRVISSKNIEVFNEIDGTVICNGDYLVIKSINNGSVMFRGTILNSEDFDGSYKMVYFEDEKVKMKEL